MTDETASAIIAALGARGIDAEYEDLGYISVIDPDEPSQHFAFRDSTSHWSGELMTHDDRLLHAYTFGHPITTISADTIAAWIAEVVGYTMPAPDGWQLSDTAREHTAFERALRDPHVPDRRIGYALITSANNAEAPRYPDEAVLLGFYDTDSNMRIQFACANTAEAVRITSRLGDIT
jgi:hypothetical protein